MTNIYSDGEFTLAGNDRCAIILRSPEMQAHALAPLDVDGVYVDHNSYWRAIMIQTRPPLALPPEGVITAYNRRVRERMDWEWRHGEEI